MCCTMNFILESYLISIFILSLLVAFGLDFSGFMKDSTVKYPKVT